MNAYTFSRSEFINGEEFRFSYFTFAGRSGTIGLALDRPPLPADGSVGHPCGLFLQTNGETQWEYDLDAVSNDLVIAYTPPLGDVLRLEQAHGQMVLGPGIASASEELGQFTVHTDLPYGIEVRSNRKVFPSEAAFYYNTHGAVRDGVRLGKEQDVGRNWLHFHQGSGVHDWRVGMDENYSLVFRTGNGKPTDAEHSGEVVLQLTKDGDVRIPAYEERIKKLEAAIAMLIARLETE